MQLLIDPLYPFRHPRFFLEELRWGGEGVPFALDVDHVQVLTGGEACVAFSVDVAGDGSSHGHEDDLALVFRREADFVIGGCCMDQDFEDGVRHGFGVFGGTVHVSRCIEFVAVGLELVGISHHAKFEIFTMAGW